MDHLILAAANEGLGTCWIGAFDPAAAREVLGLPEGVEPVVFTPLGYPADQRQPKRRRPLDTLVRLRALVGTYAPRPNRQPDRIRGRR